MDEFIDMHRTVPGFRTLHFGDVVDRHLLDDERDNDTVIAEQLGGLLVERLRRWPTGRGCASRCRSRSRSADALIKLAFRRDPDGDEAVLAEAKDDRPGLPAPPGQPLRPIDGRARRPSVRGTPGACSPR